MQVWLLLLHGLCRTLDACQPAQQLSGDQACTLLLATNLSFQGFQGLCVSDTLPLQQMSHTALLAHSLTWIWPGQQYPKCLSETATWSLNGLTRQFTLIMDLKSKLGLPGMGAHEPAEGRLPAAAASSERAGSSHAHAGEVAWPHARPDIPPP